MNYYEDLINKKAEDDEHRLILFDKIEGSDPHRAKLKINRELFEIKFESIELMDHIATGGSGAFVYRAKLNRQEIVAVKIFQTKFLNDQERFSEFEHELTIMSSIRHKNVISFYGASLDPPRVAIITEFCDNGSLANYIGSHKNDFPWETKLNILYDVCKALNYLHSKNVIHRDVKSDNILLDSKMTAKVTDFGLSKVIADLTKSHMTFHVGTSIYIAPEVVKGTSYDNKCDIYSLSIIMYEMYYETNNPYGTDVKGSIEYQVASNPSFRPHIVLPLEAEHEWYIQLMQRGWSDDPEERPSAFEMIQIMEQRMPSLTRSNSIYSGNSPVNSQQTTELGDLKKNKKKPNKFASSVASYSTNGLAQDLKG